MSTLSTWELLAFSPPGWGGNLLRGLLTSLEIAVSGYLFGMLIGIFGACGKLYGGPYIRDILTAYTTAVRAIPELVLMLLLYYLGVQAFNDLMASFGIGPFDINGFVAGGLVIGLVQGAYSTEVLRAAINAVPHGQLEAALAHGMSHTMAFRRVTFPAMLPHAIPGLANLWLVAVKDTALLAVIGFSELMMETRQAAATTKAYLTFFTATALIYLLISTLSTIAIGRLERRSRRGMTRG